MLFRSRSRGSPQPVPTGSAPPLGAGCERSDSGARVRLDTSSLWLPALLQGARDSDGAWGCLAVGSGRGATWSPQAPALPLMHAPATGQVHIAGAPASISAVKESWAVSLLPPDGDDAGFCRGLPALQHPETLTWVPCPPCPSPCRVGTQVSIAQFPPQAPWSRRGRMRSSPRLENPIL